MWEYTTYPATFQMCVYVRMYTVKYERSGFLILTSCNDVSQLRRKENRSDLHNYKLI